MNKHREMKKKSYVETVEVSCYFFLGMSLKYFTLYAVPVKGALTLPPCRNSPIKKKKIKLSVIKNSFNEEYFQLHTI